MKEFRCIEKELHIHQKCIIGECNGFYEDFLDQFSIMPEVEQTIYYMNYITSVYLGYVTIIAGLMGNVINILVFTKLKLFRNNPSAFYLIIAALVEIFQLIFVVSTRVITATNGYDPTRTSLVWCKFRAFLSQWGATMLPMIICSSAFDQYLSTSYHAALRQMSTLRLAQGLVAILCVLAAGYSVPSEIFQEIHPRLGCGTYNASYNYFFSFVHLCIIIGLLPIAVSSLFSLLAFRNVRRIVRRQIPIVRRRLDRQLTAMILVRIALFVTATLPLASVRTYQINRPVDQDNAYEMAVHTLIRMVVTTFYNINYSVFST
jgi:hypothetical protein